MWQLWERVEFSEKPFLYEDVKEDEVFFQVNVQQPQI